jgi:hypothetical protein
MGGKSGSFCRPCAQTIVWEVVVCGVWCGVVWWLTGAACGLLCLCFCATQRTERWTRAVRGAGWLAGWLAIFVGSPGLLGRGACSLGGGQLSVKGAGWRVGMVSRKLVWLGLAAAGWLGQAGASCSKSGSRCQCTDADGDVWDLTQLSGNHQVSGPGSSIWTFECERAPPAPRAPCGNLCLLRSLRFAIRLVRPVRCR